MDNNMIEAKQKAKKQLLGDLRMYGIVTGIILILFTIGQATNLGGFRDIFAESGTTAVENWIAVFLASFGAGYIFSSIGVGFKFLSLWLRDKIKSTLLLGLIILIGCQIVGMILLPIRVVVNAVGWIVASRRLKNQD